MMSESPFWSGMNMYSARFVAFSFGPPLAAVVGAMTAALSPATSATPARLALAAWLLVFASAYMLAPPVQRWLRASPTLSRAAAGRRVVVGGGWSFFLNKSGAPAAVFDARSGSLGDGWWRSGTTIAEVQAALRREGRTLCSHPSIESGTLGGWLFSNAHGSGGTLWTPQLLRVRATDLESGETRESDAKSLFRPERSTEEQRRYVIEAVRVASVENVMCAKDAFRLRTEQDALRFVTTPSYLRMAMIGRRGTMCLLWTPDDNDVARHNDPHLLSRLALWFQADVLSSWQGQAASSDWFDWPVEPRERWRSRETLHSANRFAPAPIAILAIAALGYTNFEIFVDVAVTPRLVCDLCCALERAFVRARGGRCELRCGSTRLFLDFACVRVAPELLVAVHEVVGDAPAYMHKGKAQTDVHPIVLNTN